MSGGGSTTHLRRLPCLASLCGCSTDEEDGRLSSTSTLRRWHRDNGERAAATTASFPGTRQAAGQLGVHTVLNNRSRDATARLIACLVALPHYSHDEREKCTCPRRCLSCRKLLAATGHERQSPVAGLLPQPGSTSRPVGSSGSSASPPRPPPSQVEACPGAAMQCDASPVLCTSRGVSGGEVPAARVLTPPGATTSSE